LTAEIALKKARVAEVVLKEMEEMQAAKREPAESYSTIGATTTGKSTKLVCYRCGDHGHVAPDCRFKKAKCYACQKVGHLARVCRSKNKSEASKTQKSRNIRGHVVYQLRDNSDNDSSAEEYLHSIFQLGNNSQKFIITVTINGVELKMEVDSGAEHSTIPWSVFQKKLS